MHTNLGAWKQNESATEHCLSAPSYPFSLKATNHTKMTCATGFVKRYLRCRLALFAVILAGAGSALAAHLTATTTTVASSNTNLVFGQQVVFTATVSGSGGTPTGTVTFKDGLTTLGTGSLNGSAQTTLTNSSLAAGSHSITAVYGGDST